MAFHKHPAGKAFYMADYPLDALFFFDFDGVLADQDEEKLFQLEEMELERGRLEDMARYHGINPDLYPSTGYLRHLVYQAEVFDFPIKPHDEAVEFARNLDDFGCPYFIVTARSGFSAVGRMLRFTERWRLTPHETFCLGRSCKADLLAKLRKDWPDRPFVFFEDSQRHIDAAKALNDPLLTIIQIEWPSCTKSAEDLRREYLGAGK